MNSLKAHLPRLHFQPLLAGCLAVASLLSAPATGYAQPALGSPYNGLTSDYPFSLAQVRDQRSPPAQRDRTHFAPSLAGIREQIALQGKTWVRADLRVPQVDLQRLDDQEKRIWMQDLEQMAQEVLASIPEGTYEKASRPPEFASITLSVDDIALDALRQSPLITVVEAMPPSPLVVDHSGQSRVKLTRDPIPDEYIVIYKEEAFSLAARSSGRLEADVSSLGRSLAARHRGSRHKDWTRALVGMSVRMSAADAAALAKDPRVALVEQNGYVYASEIQNSPVWGLDRVDQRELPLDAGYTYATGAHAVTAYVVDTGIRTTHAEFGGRATWGTNFAGDGNNTDCNGHGTHVAGTIGGATYGIAKDIRLVAVKVLGCDGSGTWTGVINGIDWMIANKQLPAVANLSLGGGYSASINRAVANAAAAGITMAVAAGNENTDACDSSPASEPSALTVGASTSSDARASFSNYGTCLDLFAPGQGITSSTATTDQSTGTWDGTSMATPHVAGAAALYLVANPDATPAEVASAINDNATTGLIADARTGSPNRLLFTALANDTLRLSVSKQGLGSVQSAPAGIDCGTACAAPFAPGTEVTLTATAGEGFTFSEWSGNCTGSDRTCMLTVDAVKSVQATFVDANGGTEVFPSGGVWPAGWTTPSGSSSPWSIAYEPVMEGSQSLRSGEISHNQTSAVEVAGYFQAGLVSFDWTVSSEANWDWLRFYIDGVRQDAISGCSDWTTACWKTFRQELDAGFHTLTWSYEKDYSVDSGMDSGWVDNVMLPAGGTIPANIPPVADPGGPYSGISGQTMTFDGTGSTDTDGTIVAYAWDFGDGQTGSGSTPSHTYASAGDYEVTLIVTDNDGAISDEARSSASVSDQTGAPVELFSDSFENGAWNGLWTEDRQNDWFTSTQRAVDGRYSAEIDGRASDAVLMSVPIALQGATGVTIEFAWYIESGLDSGEYLAFDASTDGGARWTEHARLRGNVDPENAWQDETVRIDNLPANASLLLRFRGRMSGSSEDANVDRVRVTAETSSEPAPNAPPTASAGGPYNGIVGQALTFDGGGSTDSDGTISSYHWDFGDGDSQNGVAPTHSYATAGNYTVTLTVRDDDGATDVDTAVVAIDSPSAGPAEVFSDSFENGAWNGLWTEDRQNDWFTSTQRAVDGRYSAEIDGRASDAVLMSVPIALQGATGVTIEFAWYIESGLDSGEYLAFDASTDGGARWTEHARLRGNVDPENAWQDETVRIDNLPANASLLLRFRGRMSGSSEDANVDSVRVLIQ